jgi:hypothetical protein
MTPRRSDQVVTVIAPSNAPHLGAIAAEIETQLLKQIETLPTDALRHLLRVGAEIARARAEYDRFRRRIIRVK